MEWGLPGSRRLYFAVLSGRVEAVLRDGIGSGKHAGLAYPRRE